MNWNLPKADRVPVCGDEAFVHCLLLKLLVEVI